MGVERVRGPKCDFARESPGTPGSRNRRKLTWRSISDSQVCTRLPLFTERSPQLSQSHSRQRKSQALSTPMRPHYHSEFEELLVSESPSELTAVFPTDLHEDSSLHIEQCLTAPLQLHGEMSGCTAHIWVQFYSHQNTPSSLCPTTTASIVPFLVWPHWHDCHVLPLISSCHKTFSETSWQMSK